MFLPVGDRPNPENYTPWVNYGLIATNIIIYGLLSVPLTVFGPDLSDPVLKGWIDGLIRESSPEITRQMIESQLDAYDVFVVKHGYRPGAPEISDLFTSLFLHANFAHLAGNMLFLWIYGDNVEHRLGRVGYLIVYLLSGLAACLFFGAINGSSMAPLIGASGAISGVLGLYFFLFPSNEIKILVVLIPFYFKAVFFKARWVLIWYVVVENLFPMWLGAVAWEGDGGGVAYGAHLGGFFFGLAAGMVSSLVVARPSAREGLSPAEFHLKMAHQRLKEGQKVSAYQHAKNAIRADPDIRPRAQEILDKIPE